MTSQTAHVDTYIRENLPPREQWPELIFDLPELQYPERMNCASILLDDAVDEGHGERIAIYDEAGAWTYRALQSHVNEIANLLAHGMGVVPGNRVLLHGLNDMMLAASWLAVVKAGAIAVTTMPMLRAKELSVIATKAKVDHALCDRRLLDELQEAAAQTGLLQRIRCFGPDGVAVHSGLANDRFTAVATFSEDPCMLAFTSGTSGVPKATVHFHRDILAMSDTVARHLLRTGPTDVHTGSPPLAFTFGLGALLVFPLRFRASTVLLEQPTADNLLRAVERTRATVLFTAPTMYRNLLTKLEAYDLSSLRQCVSAGEALPQSTSDHWWRATGLRIVEGIGSTEMTHIFIGASGDAVRPGSTGKTLPGYRACVLDESHRPLPAGSIGRLAVKGPTGCRYLLDERQSQYVIDGWNVTGDAYRFDEDGYFWFQGRVDDMIVSAGYNIAGPEVEAALLEHAAVQECAVVGKPDAERGYIVKAFVVLREGHCPSSALASTLQDFVKQRIAPYKYPREIAFVGTLPKTPTGKVQRHKLRMLDRES